MRLSLHHFRKPALIAIALIGALLLTVFRDERPSLARRGTNAQIVDEQGGLSDEYRAARLPILNRVIMLVHERYIEPERIDQRAMLLGGLDYIQRTVAEVLLQHEEGSDEITVQVDTASQNFTLADLDRPWALSFRFREIFRFIAANLRSEDVTLRDIEYAAANGMLHTLDPHSVLLVPELYEEMRLGTQGEFGGLGIVISIRDGQLTIISPIDGTPAARAGLRSMDRIVMIGEETTINMTLEEAVDRLRGAPGTKVSIRISRRGWTEPRPIEITRAIIRIESIESRLLPNGVGYLRIRNFQGNTYDDLRQHLEELRQQGMRSLILDLRDDPGGLLDQAVRVADAFLSEGAIVTTAAADPTDRESRRARPEGTEPNYPIAVLVNSGSASASEIVAGALRGNNRAIVIGERTFGKGSVQVLYDFEDGSALKLTIAHYLTPGDVSIQSVGIIPDIEVVPMVVSQSQVDLVLDESSLRESSLESHLEGHVGTTPAERPTHRIQYYVQGVDTEPEAEENDGEQEGEGQEGNEGQGEADAGVPDAGGEETPAVVEEPTEEDSEALEARLLENFEIRLGHDLLRKMGRAGDRLSLIERAGKLVSNRQEIENSKVADGLGKLGVSWGPGRDRGETNLDVQVLLGPPEEGRDEYTIDAGQRVELTVKVTNNGNAPVYRLHATTHSDNPYINDRELPLGRIDPGQTKSWSIRVRLPRDLHSRLDPVSVSFTELHDHAPPDQEVWLGVRGLDRPTFSYSYHVVDVERGNGDGRLSLGERIRLIVTVTNRGPGRAFHSQVNIKNESGEGVLIHDGRFAMGEFEPGETRMHSFEVEVLPTFSRPEVKLELAITEFDLREEVSESLLFPLVEPAELRALSSVVRIGERVPLYEWPHADAHQVGWIAQGAICRTSAEQGAFVRLEIDEQRSGWIGRRFAVTHESEGPLQPGFENRMDNTPPEIELSGDVRLRQSEPTLRLQGVVSDADRVLDMYIFVGRRKVFYLSNREGSDLRRLAFDAPLPLETGSNTILVVARESGDVVARRVLVVRRDDPAGSNTPTRGQ